MGALPGWDEEIHGAIKALVSLVGDRLPLLTTSRTQSQVRQLGAAYLARTRRLVMGMDVLYENGMPDLVGGLMRICLDAWVTGMWVLVVGDDAIDRLNAEHVAQSNVYIEKTGIVPDPLPTVGGPQTPPLTDMAKAVEESLRLEGDANAGEVVASHRVVYGGESAVGIHAGLASVLGHLKEGTIETRSWKPEPKRTMDRGNCCGRQYFSPFWLGGCF